MWFIRQWSGMGVFTASSVHLQTNPGLFSLLSQELVRVRRAQERELRCPGGSGELRGACGCALSRLSAELRSTSDVSIPAPSIEKPMKLCLIVLVMCQQQVWHAGAEPDHRNLTHVIGGCCFLIRRLILLTNLIFLVALDVSFIASQLEV